MPATLRRKLETPADAAKRDAPCASMGRDRRAPRFAPAGQSSQMIAGANGADDRAILIASGTLCRAHGLKRVCHSAFSAIPGSSAARPAPLRREERPHRSGWLLRFCGFAADEIVPAGAGAMLGLDTDARLAWALRIRHLFPVDLNRAPREMRLCVPGLGLRNAGRLLGARRHMANWLQDPDRPPMRRLRALVLPPRQPALAL